MRETKIIQVYPSDYAIEKAIKEWESFGWEMTGNQRYSDENSVYLPYLGTETTTTTYNKLTFSREKSSQWYPEVKRLEEEYEEVQRRISSIMNEKPVKKGWGFLDVLTVYLPVPLISFIVYQIVKKVKYKKAVKRFEENSTKKLEDLNSEADVLRYTAFKAVNAT